MRNRVQRKQTEGQTKEQNPGTATPTAAATAAPQIGAPAPAETRPGATPPAGGEGQGTRARRSPQIGAARRAPAFHPERPYDDSDPEHWTQEADPSTDADKAQVFASYDPGRMIEDNPEAAAILVAELYNDWRNKEFEDGMAKFHGLFNLMRHNPHFRPEVEALRNMIEGEIILNQFAGKVRAL